MKPDLRLHTSTLEDTSIARTADHFTELWSAHATILFKKCLLWTSGRYEEAEEAFSRAGLIAFQKYPGRDRLTNERAWLLRLAYNACMDLHRDARRRKHLASGESEDFENLAFSSQSPECSSLGRELSAFLLGCIGELPSRLRSVMELHVHSEKNYGSIAETLGLTEVNVRKRIQQARSILLHRLRAYEAGRAHSIPPARAAERAREVPPTSPLHLARITAVRSIRYLPDAGRWKHELLFLRYEPGPCSLTRLSRLAAHVESHPRGWRKRLELARLLRELERPAEAAGEYRFVLDRQPRCLPAWLELAETLFSLGCPQEAAAACEGALGSTPPGSPSHELFRGILSGYRRRWDEAGEILRACAAADPDNPDILATLGGIHLRAGLHSEALEAFAAALAIDPENPILQRAREYASAWVKESHLPPDARLTSRQTQREEAEQS